MDAATASSFYGTKGTLTINRKGFEIVPDRALTPESQIPSFTEPARSDDDTRRSGPRR